MFFKNSKGKNIVSIKKIFLAVSYPICFSINSNNGPLGKVNNNGFYVRGISTIKSYISFRHRFEEPGGDDIRTLLKSLGYSYLYTVLFY